MTEKKTTTKKALTFPELQTKMQVGKESKQGVSFRFRNVETIANHFKSLNSGWTLTFSDRIEEIAGRVFVKATARVFNADEKYEATAYAELSQVPKTKSGANQMQVPQWSGAVSSYARKYAVQGLFAIGEEDVDSYEYEEPPTISEQQARDIHQRIAYVAEASGAAPDKILASLLGRLGVQAIEMIHPDGYGYAVEFLDMLSTRAQSRQQEPAQQPRQAQQPTPPQNRQDFDMNSI